jgi:hypothetical protein
MPIMFPEKIDLIIGAQFFLHWILFCSVLYFVTGKRNFVTGKRNRTSLQLSNFVVILSERVMFWLWERKIYHGSLHVPG